MALYNILLYKICCRVGNIEIINILEMKKLENILLTDIMKDVKIFLIEFRIVTGNAGETNLWIG